jgi:serine/threonine protein kinase
MNTRARGRKSQVLPTTTQLEACNDPAGAAAEEPKVHASGGASLRRILLSRSSALYLCKFLIGLAVLSIGWTLASRFEISWPLFQREERVYPRYVRHLIVDEKSHFDKLDMNMDYYPSKRTIYVSPEELKAQEHLWDGGYYRRNRVEQFETDTCKAMYDWQLKSFPTCNTLYEFDLTNLRAKSTKDMQVRLLNNGYWRDVWMVREGETQEKRVLKTIRYEHQYVERNYDRHRRDAVAMERLTSSPHVVNIYGFCGNSGLFEFAGGGDISNAIWPKHEDEPVLTRLEKLEIATQAAMGLAALHNFNKEGQASIAHTDITPGQYVFVDGIFKLNDFNRARFIRWDPVKKEPCTYHVGNNPGTVSCSCEQVTFGSGQVQRRSSTCLILWCLV